MDTAVIMPSGPTQVRKCQTCRKVFVAIPHKGQFMQRCKACRESGPEAAPVAVYNQDEEYEQWRREGEWRSVGDGCYRRKRSSG